jgi:hypothetical protein
MLVILPNKRTEVNRKPKKSGHNPQSGRACRYATRAATRGHEAPTSVIANAPEPTALGRSTAIADGPDTMVPMPIDAGVHPSELRQTAVIGIAITFVAVLLVACSSGSSSSSGAGAAPLKDASGHFVVASLGLRFSLPSSFAKVDDPEFGFLARSQNPPAVFSIDPDSPDVAHHEREAGELVSTIDIGGTPAVLVKHAVVGRLPAGIEAYELLVARGDRSFSVILSAASAELAHLWTPFVASLSVS